MAGKSDKLMVDGKRVDGRDPSDLRNVRMQVGVLHDADGSAFIEWGKNKVLCGVYGPRECIPRHQANPYKSLIKCRYTMSPFSSAEEHGRSGPNRRSTEISKVIREVFDNLIITESFPKTEIDIYMEVLQADGGTRTSSITAASLALANAGIPMRDMVAAVAAGKANNTLMIDLGKEEDNHGQSDMALAISHRKKELLLVQMDGMLTRDELEKLLIMAEQSANKIHEMQAASLKNVYENPEESFKL